MTLQWVGLLDSNSLEGIHICYNFAGKSAQRPWPELVSQATVMLERSKNENLGRGPEYRISVAEEVVKLFRSAWRTTQTKRGHFLGADF